MICGKLLKYDDRAIYGTTFIYSKRRKSKTSNISSHFSNLEKVQNIHSKQKEGKNKGKSKGTNENKNVYLTINLYLEYVKYFKLNNKKHTRISI